MDTLVRRKAVFSLNGVRVFNALTAVGALMTLTDFNLSNGRRFYSSMGNPLAVKGLKKKERLLATRIDTLKILNYVWC